MDQHGTVLNILVASRRDATAASRFFRKLLTGLEYVPRVLVTDKLDSYASTRHQVCARSSTQPSGNGNERRDRIDCCVVLIMTRLPYLHDAVE